MRCRFLYRIGQALSGRGSELAAHSADRGALKLTGASINSNDSEHGHCVSVQVLSHIGWDDYRRSKKLTTPHYPSDGGFALLADVVHCEIRSLACLGLNCAPLDVATRKTSKQREPPP